MKKFLTLATAIVSILLISSAAGAAVSANLTYVETALQDGWYQYDYTAFNTSTTANAYLYDLGFWHYNEAATFEWLSRPTGWVDPGTWSNWMEETYSDGFAYDIPAGSSLSGFSFKTDYQAGSIEFDALFRYQTPAPYGTLAGTYGGMTSGTSVPVVPEPISAILFLSGGATLAFRKYAGKKQKAC